MFKNLLLLIVFVCSAGFLSAQEGTKIKISTEFGDMIAVLYDDTPIHKENFLNNIKDGVYDGNLFHRVMHGFMAQGGNPVSKTATIDQALSSDDCGTIENEITYKHFHKKGALSAARLPDVSNPERASSACQFFVVQGTVLNDEQLTEMETESYRFPDINRATYKIRGGSPLLDMKYTVFGEVISGFDVIDMIHAMPTGWKVVERPNTNITFTITVID